jgi:RNase H-fold protein (predicted Holliday junction resolvase)
VAAGRVLSVDPGTGKVGYAVLERDGTVLTQGIEPVGTLAARLEAIRAEHEPESIAVGRGTNSSAVIRSLGSLGLPVREVDEYETTRFARGLYFADHPPAGWRRLVPVSMQVPPRPVDDYAAILIGRRYLDEEGRAGSAS